MAVFSLLLLIGILAAEILTKINIGFLGILSALGLAAYARIENSAAVLNRFPAELFLTLLGIFHLFSIPESNGTLERVFQQLMKLCRTSRRSLPWLLFHLSLGISAMGAGNIAAAALIAPLGMLAAKRHQISPFLIAIMIANGANAGALSPLAPAGLIMSLKMQDLHLPSAPFRVFLYVCTAHLLVSIMAWFALKRHLDGTMGPAAILAGTILAFMFPKRDFSSMKAVPWSQLP